MRFHPVMSFLLAAGALLSAGDVPVDIAARFVKIVSSGHVVCKDAAMAAALGAAVDAESKFAWAASESEVKSFKAAGKCVITSKVEWLASGGSIAIVEEGGKPQMYIHSGNVAASGVTLPDAVLKVSKRQ